MPLLFNEKVTIENHVVSYKKLYDKDSHIVNNSVSYVGEFYSRDQIKSCYPSIPNNVKVFFKHKKVLSSYSSH